MTKTTRRGTTAFERAAIAAGKRDREEEAARRAHAEAVGRREYELRNGHDALVAQESAARRAGRADK